MGNVNFLCSYKKSVKIASGISLKIIYNQNSADDKKKIKTNDKA